MLCNAIGTTDVCAVMLAVSISLVHYVRAVMGSHTPMSLADVQGCPWTPIAVQPAQAMLGSQSNSLYSTTFSGTSLKLQLVPLHLLDLSILTCSCTATAVVQTTDRCTAMYFVCAAHLAFIAHQLMIFVGEYYSMSFSALVAVLTSQALSTVS